MFWDVRFQRLRSIELILINIIKMFYKTLCIRMDYWSKSRDIIFNSILDLKQVRKCMHIVTNRGDLYYGFRISRLDLLYVYIHTVQDYR
jgi:hypothetical protein